MRFVVASQVPLVLDLASFFTAGISAELLPGYWLWIWGGDTYLGRSLMDIVPDILLRVCYNLLLLAGGGFYGCSLLESKSLLRSVCQLRRLNWI